VPDSAWTALAGTALGGFLAAGGGWLNGRAQSRRERDKEIRAARRTAYLEYLYRSQELYATAEGVFFEVRGPSQGDRTSLSVGEQKAAEMRIDVEKSFVAYNRARQALEFTAPREIRDQMRVRDQKLRSYATLTYPVLEGGRRDVDQLLEKSEHRRRDLLDENDRELLVQMMKKDVDT